MTIRGSMYTELNGIKIRNYSIFVAIAVRNLSISVLGHCIFLLQM